MSQAMQHRGIHPSGFRLPADARLGRVRLQVASLERSLAYYEQVVGFRVAERSPARATLGAPEGPVLVELEERAGARPVPRRGRLGLYHFAILLPDRRALGTFATHLAGRGVPAGASDHRVSEALYLQDPDGLGIEVYADRPRSSWRYDAEGQLAMATEPLDVGALVRDAGEAEWSGVPAGTTIGHVHLHVGDLERAANFFHRGLGLDKVVWNYPGALFLSAGGYHHYLGLNSWAAGAPAPTEADARLLDWEIVLPDIRQVEAAARSLESAGYNVSRDGSLVTATDPWGTAVRLRGE